MPHFLQEVTPEWIKEQLDKHELGQKDLAIALNVDKANISNWLNERVNLSKPARAALYYYFQAKDRGM